MNARLDEPAGGSVANEALLPRPWAETGGRQCSQEKHFVGDIGFIAGRADKTRNS